MNTSLFFLRLQKITAAVLHPAGWRPLLAGVAASIEHNAVLKPLDVDGVVDVGANRGQFSLLARMMYPRLSIVAFEPIPDEAATFLKIHKSADNVHLIQAALGEQIGKAALHVSGTADSSSLLPIGKRQTDLFPETAEQGTIEVDVSTLDTHLDLWTDESNLLLKIDVQGFELPVLRGGPATLKRCKYVYVECSEVPLYDGQTLRPVVEDLLSMQGFALQSRHNEQYDGQELVQADYLFVRR